MAAQKKRTPAAKETEETLASARTVPPAEENGGECETVCVKGSVEVQGRSDLPPGVTPPPIRFEPAGTIKVESVSPVEIQLQRARVGGTADQALWAGIRDNTNAIRFENYDSFIQGVLCANPDKEETPELAALRRRVSELRYGVDAYQLLKVATEVFLILNCGSLPATHYVFDKGQNRFILQSPSYDLEAEQTRFGRALTKGDIENKLGTYLSEGLPYIKRVLGGLDPAKIVVPSPFCATLIYTGPFQPCLLELIWSYWHEEGMLVQALNAISLRFQNKRPSERNPLTQLELSPLRPLSNLLWGYVQDEPFRLTVARRAYEYSHHYGLSLVGKAVPAMRPADNRSKFLEAFHSLLRRVAIFYDRDADTTVIADGFPLLNGLQEVHMLLAEGAHNQFRDLPWTARVEMLIQQWLLSRQEMLEFLRGRAMVPYKEPWIGPADTVRRLLGWGDTPVTHFRDLAVWGEQILLSIRYGDWVEANAQDQAKNWARYWKPEIQGYIHAYRAVTGIDLGAGDQTQQKVDATLPSVLLQRRMAQQGTR